MPKRVTPQVFRIAATKVDQVQVNAWLDHIGVSDDFALPDVSHPAAVIALAAKRCYMSFEPGLNPNVTRVRENYVKYFDNILSSGHGSVLEHACFSYAIEGVSRVFTAEMNRHRAGWAISEGSLRFVKFGDCIPYTVPPSLQPDPCDTKANAERKEATLRLFDEAFAHQEAIYRKLDALWDASDRPFAYKKKVTSLFRRIVGMGVATGGVWTGNVRALRHVLAMRCHPSAEEEIASVFSTVALDMRDREPLLFGDFEDRDGYWQPKYRKV